MTDSVAIISASQPLAEPTPPTQPTGGDRITAKETVSTMIKTWKGSLLLKIISGVVVVILILTIVFLCTTVTYSSDKSDCDKDLKSQKSKVEGCNKDLKECKDEAAKYKSDLEAEKKTNDQLRTEIKGLNDKVKGLEDQVKQKDQEISSLNDKNKDLTNKVSQLEVQVRNLQNEVNQKESEINHLKNEVHTKDTEIAKIKNELKYYQWGAVGSGVVHLGFIIDDIATHSSLSSERKKAETLDNENRNLKGELNNAHNKVKELEAETERLKQEIIHVNELRQQCQQDLAHERELFEECKRDEEKYKRQIGIIPNLALEQAKLQLLLQDSKKTMATSLVYNSTEHGFHKNELINRVGQRKPTVVIVRTTTGYVFGGAINIEWSSSGGLQTDAGAFTFSTTHNHICKIKNPSRAVYFNDEYFMEFGDPEFWIEKTDSKLARGNAQSDRAYDCGAQDPQTFYNDGIELTVQELLIYHVEIHAA